MANVNRRAARSRTMASYIGNFSQVGATETANNQRLTGTTDFLFSIRAYWRIIELEYYRDPFSNTEITNRVDFLADYSFRILNERSGEYTHHALAKISTDITSNLDVDISFIWDRILNPQATDDGTVEVQQ